MIHKRGLKGVLIPPYLRLRHTHMQAHTPSMLRAIHSLMESHAAHLSFTHHWPSVSERDDSERQRQCVCVFMSVCIPSICCSSCCMHMILSTHTHRQNSVSSKEYVLSKVCLLSCMERHISVCMNACVIVRACSRALLSMRFALRRCLLAWICCHMASAQEHTRQRQCRGKRSHLLTLSGFS